ncbi:flavin reductase (DIM6/NTAB) family NADH-FMN oxidoreductase RutF [Desulfobaculum xiamenense]|uniref:Flavin reductase (DIM6/NTAB) family NADH-FMN oxidoreductase RutF n=1 Tax=Desulfobaculum xiamenense TaxID=995050 RepID=A0A846QT82_9BACT|nr:flavin reductase family protein [Desulfobaculum xiamenense]NJB68384.1 flavin reductase (DIM6/NTAB) family NADH-FMN oxidoreductase RutF [Desulfobaculum xiamenense]
MRESLGALNALYPSLTVLAGAVVNGRENFITIAHVGILNHGKTPYISVSIAKEHHTTKGIHAHRAFSVNIPGENLVAETDYCGLVSGKTSDKAALFDIFYGETDFAPMIRQCPVCMECRLHSVIDLNSHDVFVGEVVRTHANPDVLTNGKVDITKLRPLLFDMASKKYWSIGQPVADCWSIGKTIKDRT